VVLHTLKERHSEWQEYRHDPKFCCAWEEPIPRIDKEYEHKIDMEECYCRKDHLGIPYPYRERCSASIQQVQFGGQEQSVYDGHDDVYDAECVSVWLAAIELSSVQNGSHSDHSGCFAPEVGQVDIRGRRRVEVTE
jgi:hypothetical protein